MDPNSPLPRKVKFKPKAPKRNSKLIPSISPKIEEEDINESQAAKDLLEYLETRGAKNEKKSSVQVAYSNIAASSGQIRSFGVTREGNNVITSSSGTQHKASYDDEKVINFSPSAVHDKFNGFGKVVESSDRKKKEYREPWDYNHSYYPITLPLRPPHSGDPETAHVAGSCTVINVQDRATQTVCTKLLDEREFRGSAMDFEYNENTVNSALELGLLEEIDEPQMLFLQLPSTLPIETPLEKRLAATPQKDKGKEKVGEVRAPKGLGLTKSRGLENLSKGHMGKLLVYKSGAIKWKIGEIAYDVTPGVSCDFAQDVVVMNISENHACNLGELGKRAVITPNIDSLLN